MSSAVLLKSAKVFLSILTMGCIIFANLMISGSPLAANHIVEVRADAGINNFTNITTSKPSGNYTNGTALVTEGPRQIIQSKPSGNYTNATALVTEGPRQIIQSKPTGNYTNATALVTEGPRQIITGRPAMGQVAPQNQPGLNTPNTIPGSSVISIPNINITKEQAVKAEQEAKVMIKDYYEKVKQEEEQKAKQQAAALAPAAQVNQTINNASQAEGSLQDNATASAIETEDDTDVEAEGEDESEEDEENDNENGGNEEEEEDSE